MTSSGLKSSSVSVYAIVDATGRIGGGHDGDGGRGRERLKAREGHRSKGARANDDVPCAPLSPRHDFSRHRGKSVCSNLQALRALSQSRLRRYVGSILFPPANSIRSAANNVAEKPRRDAVLHSNAAFLAVKVLIGANNRAFFLEEKHVRNIPRRVLSAGGGSFTPLCVASFSLFTAEDEKQNKRKKLQMPPSVGALAFLHARACQNCGYTAKGNVCDMGMRAD